MTETEILLKALSNQKRLEIFRFIREQKIVIKNEVLTHFQMHRAGLDHHLDLLADAGLIELHEITIKNKKYVFLYANADFQIKIAPLETAKLRDFLPQNLSSETFNDLSGNIWLTEDIKDPILKEKLLTKLSEKLELQPWEYFCNCCRNQAGVMKCSQCGEIVCIECAEIIVRSDGADEANKVIFCLNCIASQFS
ncbi:MAG: hypothetical protein ACFFBD_08835 [Candidatus Hodarchaeota archaeon]